MASRLVPNKNHKAFLKELCASIKDYDSIKDFRNKEELAEMLKNRLPHLFSNFDKSDPMFEPVSMILYDIFQNLGTVIKFVKEDQ